MSDSQTVSSNHIASLTSDMAKMDKACSDAAKINKDSEELKEAQGILDKLRPAIANMTPARTELVKFDALRKIMTAQMKVVLGLLKKVEATSSLGKVVYANGAVKAACKDAKVQTKIESLLHTPGELGHGVVKNISAKGHSHVTNKDGIAYNWKGSDLHVVGYGVKNDKAAPGNSKYDWVT